MQLALRSLPPTRATAFQRVACKVIKTRLVSEYSHGGIVIGGRLLHATAADGLHAVEHSDWSPERWELFDLGNKGNARALDLFDDLRGASYDWFSLLAFVGLSVRDSSRMYCFEWCWLAMTGEVPNTRITPEMLLRLAIKS